MIANPSQAVLMLLNLAFTREEQIELEAFASATSSTQTFKQSLEAWSETSHRLAAGALDNGFSRAYSDGLQARTTIELILRRCPAELATKLEQVLSRLDGDFKRLTRDDGGASLSRIVGRKDGWWWQREPMAPKKL